MFLKFFKKEKQKKEISTFKAARRALIASVVSLVVCFSMLSGTTFAWFTDSVSNTNNKIEAGYTDFAVKKYNSESKSFIDEVNSDTRVFPEKQWEPGDVCAAYYEITNTGNLDIILNAELVASAIDNAPEGTPDLSNYMVLKAIISKDQFDYSETADVLKVQAGTNVGAKNYKTNLFPADNDITNVIAPNDSVYIKVIAYLPNFDGAANPKPLIFTDKLNTEISKAKCEFAMSVNAFQVIKDEAITYKTCEWKDANDTDNTNKLTLKQVPVENNNKIWKNINSQDGAIYAFDEDSFKSAIQYVANHETETIILLNDIFITEWQVGNIPEFKGTIKSYSDKKFTIWGLNKRMFNTFNGNIERVVFKNSIAPNVYGESKEGDNNNYYVYNGILAAKAGAQAKITKVDVLYTDISDTPGSELVQDKTQIKYIGALIGFAEEGMKLDEGIDANNKSTALGNRSAEIGLIGNRNTQEPTQSNEE